MTELYDLYYYNIQEILRKVIKQQIPTQDYNFQIIYNSVS